LLNPNENTFTNKNYGIERDALPKPSNYFPTLGVRTIEKSQNHGVLES